MVITLKKTKIEKDILKEVEAREKRLLIKSKHSVSPQSQLPDLITYSVKDISRDSSLALAWVSFLLFVEFVDHALQYISDILEYKR